MDAAHLEVPLERLERALAEHNQTSGRPYRLRASIGYALWDPVETLNLEELVMKADKEMYRAKNKGGRR